MPKPSTRRLKVAPHYKSLYPRLAVSSQLRLQGDWLKAAGFEPGRTVTVEVEAGRLVITAN